MIEFITKLNFLELIIVVYLLGIPFFIIQDINKYLIKETGLKEAREENNILKTMDTKYLKILMLIYIIVISPMWLFTKIKYKK